MKPTNSKQRIALKISSAKKEYPFMINAMVRLLYVLFRNIFGTIIIVIRSLQIGKQSDAYLAIKNVRKMFDQYPFRSLNLFKYYSERS